MRECSGIKASGERCKALAIHDSQYCPAHDPSRAEERKAAASRAAHAKNSASEIVLVKRRIKKIADDVLAHRVERGDAAVFATLYGVLLKALEQERRQLETEELAARLEALEQMQPTQGGGRAWRR